MSISAGQTATVTITANAPVAATASYLNVSYSDSSQLSAAPSEASLNTQTGKGTVQIQAKPTISGGSITISSPCPAGNPGPSVTLSIVGSTASDKTMTLPT